MGKKRSKTAAFRLALTIVIIIYGLVVAGLADAASPKPIVLKWTIHFPDGNTTTEESLKWFASETEKRTEGRVKSKFYWGSVLGKVPDFLKMVGGKGIADVGYIIPPFVPWEIPLWTSGSLPFLAHGVRTAPKAILQLYNEWSPMQEEWKKVNCKPLGAFSSHAYFLWSKVPLEELKGKRVTTPTYWIPIMKQYGAATLSMPAPQFYEALQRGVIHATTMPLHTGIMFRFAEVVDYAYDFGFVGGQSIPTMAINLDVWNKIDPADQKVMEEIALESMTMYMDGIEKEIEELIEGFKQKGLKIISIPPDEQKRIRDATAEEIWSSWIVMAESKGVDVRNFLSRYKATIAEISK
jgi:TRAP-type C4-dicarboxylate transport system substrate-binding protein